MARKFFFVCGGILMQITAYTLGANSVVAASGKGSVAGIAVYGNDALVITTEGDVYQATNNETDNWKLRANVFEVAASQ